MLTLIPEEKQKKIEVFFKKILEFLNIKLYVYKAVILPNQQIALHRLRNILKKSSPLTGKTSGKKKILFNSIDARYGMHTYHEGGLAKALQIRGHEVKMLICGGYLKTCVGHFTIKKKRSAWRCKNCVSFSRKFYETTGLPYATYGDYITEEEIATITKRVNEMPIKKCRNLVHKGVNVSFHAKTSADRYFIGAKTEKETYDSVFRSELITAIISTDVAEKVLANEKPDIMVNSHGCYSTWGSFTDYFVNKGIRVCVWYTGWYTGYKKNTVIFDVHKVDEYFEKYYVKIRKKKPLRKAEEKELSSFLNNRMRGREGDTALYGFSDEEKDLEKLFNFDKYDKTYVMFPNVAWDSSMVTEIGEIFKDAYEWVSYTIELFKEKPNFQLIIKIHPAEIVQESETTIYDYIKNNFGTLPENIKILPSDTTISAYSLFPYINAGLMCSGTLCIEMALNNVPVIMVGKSRYSKLSFTNSVSSKEKYKRILEKGVSTLSKNDKELARIYAYFYFIKSFVPRYFLYYNSFLDLGWNINSLDDLDEGKDKCLDHICDYIINDGVYQDW